MLWTASKIVRTSVSDRRRMVAMVFSRCGWLLDCVGKRIYEIEWNESPNLGLDFFKIPWKAAGVVYLFRSEWYSADFKSNLKWKLPKKLIPIFIKGVAYYIADEAEARFSKG